MRGWSSASSAATGPTSASAKSRSRPCARCSPKRSRSAAAGAHRRSHDRQTLALRLVCLDRLGDRAVHAVGDLVRELDAYLLEAGRLQSRLVLALRQRAGDAADVGAAFGALFGRQLV